MRFAGEEIAVAEGKSSFVIPAAGVELFPIGPPGRGSRAIGIHRHLAAPEDRSVGEFQQRLALAGVFFAGGGFVKSIVARLCSGRGDGGFVERDSIEQWFRCGWRLIGHRE